MDYEFRESSSHHHSTHTHDTDDTITYYLPVHTQPFWQQPAQYPAFYEVPMSYQPTRDGGDYNYYWQDVDARQFFPGPFFGPRPFFPGPIIPGPFIGPFPIPPVPIYPPFPPVPPFPPFFW